MRRTRIYAYNNGSRSARALSGALNVLRLRHEGSRFRQRSSDLIINWGSGSCPYANVLNPSSAVTAASDKLLALRALENHDSINVPPFTTNRDVANQWLDDNKKVVCRTLLRANSGRGIVVAETQGEMVQAPLYTQYVPKTQEYRVHVFDGEVLDVQRKARNRDIADEDVNWQIRNHSNGFIFAREGVTLPQAALEQAVEAVSALSLDFGAVDMIYNERRDTYYVLEVNTAPGLEGTTLEKYVEKINVLRQ